MPIDNKSGGFRLTLRSRFATLALVLLAIACASSIASARFRQPSDEYAARRAKLRAAVDGPIVLYGYTGNEDASEVAIFFQEPSFYYLTGHSEPGAVLLISPGASDAHPPSEVLYLPPRNLNPHDSSSEVWEGPKIGPDDPDVSAKTGFAHVEPIAKLKDDLAKLAATYKTFYTLLPPENGEEGYPHFTESTNALRSMVPGAKVKDIAPRLFALRQVKSEGELALLQKAIDLSIDAHFAAIDMMHPGLFEYQVAARMKEIHEWGGCAREAYAPIVGTGFNSTVLHYSALDSQINDGDVVVMDVGGEYGGYAADITRTLPANGKFTPRQREIYDLVLGAQNAAMAAVKPGATILGRKDSLQQIVLDYFNSHPDKQGRVLTKYYPHGVSHHLGLDVHDPGDRTRPLEPGMVITVEPGLYIPEEKIGVRIEDDVLVTKDGYKLLTARLPRTADEIEKLMAEGRNKATKTTPCLFDPERGEVPGCIREEATGELFVAPDHLKDLAFDSGGLAAVRSPEYGWTYVDRNGKVLVRGVAVMDNGPDSFHDGLVRIVKYRKYGFASRDGRIVVPAVYDGALNFEQGLAAVCQGCKTKCVDPDCEYHSFNGGDWFQINKKGDVVGTLPARN